MLLIPKHLQDELKDEAKERASHFAKDTIEELAQKYHERMPELNEFWILIAAKRDKRSGTLNAFIRAVDRDHLHLVNIPLQGAQLWYINWKTGQKKLEWILPLQAKKSKLDAVDFSKNNPIIQDSLNRSERCLGRNLVSGK